MGRRAYRALGTTLCGLLLLPLSTGGAEQWPSTADEVKLGTQISKEIESHYRVVTNPAQVERMTRIGETVAREVERQDLAYRFRILQIGGVNALAVPGGWVYVTEGMVKFIRSDDELAAVLAHELTHINHRHYYIQQERASRMTPALLIAAALSVLAHSAAPLLGAQLVTQGALANYQRDLEKDADLTGIGYLTRTPFSPVAMLTLMEHLAQADRLSGQPDDLGIYQDHPKPGERVAYIGADLKRRGIPIVRRRAEGYLQLTLDPPAPAAGQPVSIRVDGEPVLTLGAAVDGHAPAERAEAVVARLDAFFNRDPAPYDIRTVHLLDRWRVLGAESLLFEVTTQDAAYARTTPQAFAEEIRNRLARAVAAAPYNRKY